MASVIAVAARVVEKAAPGQGETVLDVGSGTGNAALLAAARGADVTGVDPAGRLLELARQHPTADRRDVTFVEGTAEALPVPDGSVDLVLSVFGVVFSTDPAAAAAELARVTSECGRIVLTAWLPEGAMHEMAQIAQDAVFGALGIPRPPAFPWHDAEALSAQFASLGFSVDS